MLAVKPHAVVSNVDDQIVAFPPDRNLNLAGLGVFGDIEHEFPDHLEKQHHGFVTHGFVLVVLLHDDLEAMVFLQVVSKPLYSRFEPQVVKNRRAELKG